LLLSNATGASQSFVPTTMRAIGSISWLPAL
jgi:hypothetical protein